MQASASKRWSFAASMSTEVEGAEAEAPAAPTGELTELARLEIRVGKIVEVKHAREQ
jgi:leucyl aminopeptidase (aminopeptidase T)